MKILYTIITGLLLSTSVLLANSPVGTNRDKTKSEDLAPINGPHIVFKTNMTQNASLSIEIEDIDQNAWIDLNGNQICDEGEKLLNKKTSYLKVQEQEITIYGKIKSLDLYDNYVENISFHNCDDLETLILSRNLLNELDLSNLINLKSVECFSNQLTKIKLDNCEQLQTLDISENEITDLELPKLDKLNNLKINVNKLEGESVDKFIESLQTHSSKNKGTIIAIETRYNREMNVFTSDQVEKILQKNWIVLDNSTNNDYEGSDPNADPTEGLSKVDGPSITFHTTANIGEEINIMVEDDEENAWIDLNNNKKFDKGERLISNTSNYITIDSQDITCYGTFTYFDASRSLIDAICFKDQDKLSKIDLSKNMLNKLVMNNYMYLLSAYVNDNNLEKLDFSGCKKLGTVRCQKNNLKDINFKGCRLLSNLQCEENQLDTLDLKGKRFLEVLSCQKNNLKGLDLTDNAALRNVVASDNQLEDFRIKGCNELNFIMLSNNKINNDVMKQCIEDLPQKTERNIGTLYFYDDKSENKDLEQNSCNKSVIKAAINKNWRVKTESGKDYEGVSDVSTQNVDLDNISIRKYNNIIHINLPNDLVDEKVLIYDISGNLIFNGSGSLEISVEVEDINKPIILLVKDFVLKIGQ